MEITHLATQTNAETVGRLPCHKPEVQRLVVNLDTGTSYGSGEDGGERADVAVPE